MDDACSFWPDRIGDLDWSECCIAHDAAYGLGGDAAARMSADAYMAQCVSAVAGWPMALVMLAGVVAFGWVFWRRRR